MWGDFDARDLVHFRSAVLRCSIPFERFRSGLFTHKAKRDSRPKDDGPQSVRSDFQANNMYMNLLRLGAW